MDETNNTKISTPDSHAAFTADAKTREAEREIKNAARYEQAAVLSMLHDAKQSQRILRGKIIGTTNVYDGKVCAVTVMYEGLRIIIPFEDMYVNFALTVKEGESEATVLKRKSQILNNTVGAEIDFVIRDYMADDNGDIGIVGSRKDALIRQQRTHYIKNTPNSIHVEANQIYDGTVLSVGQRGMMVCVYGVDINLRVANITYRYVSSTNLREMYPLGSTVKVYIKSIGLDENGYCTAIGNCKLPELKKYAQNIKHIKEGDEVRAVITRLELSKPNARGIQVPVAWLFLQDINVPCTAVKISVNNINRPLRAGDTVLMRVDTLPKTGEAPVVRGSIVRFLASEPTFNRYNSF